LSLNSSKQRESVGRATARSVGLVSLVTQNYRRDRHRIFSAGKHEKNLKGK